MTNDNESSPRVVERLCHCGMGPITGCPSCGPEVKSNERDPVCPGCGHVYANCSCKFPAEGSAPVVQMQDEIAASLALVRAKLVRVEGADHEDEAQLVEAIAELRGIQEAVGGAHQYEDQFNGTAKCGACGGALEDPEHGQNWKPLPMTARIEGGVLTAYPRLPRDVRASLEWQQGPQTVAFAVMGDLSQGADDAPKKEIPEQPHADTARLNYLERKALEPSPHGYIALAIFPFTRTGGAGDRGSRISLADVAEEADDRLDEYAEGGTLREAIDAALAASAPKVPPTGAVLVCRERDGECPTPAKCRASGCPLEAESEGRVL